MAVVFSLVEIKVIKDQFRYMNMMQHENSKIRYNILMYKPDCSKITFNGPNFKFEDANVFYLNLTGSAMPDNLAMKQDTHSTAAIEKEDETSGLFLQQISTEIR